MVASQAIATPHVDREILLQLLTGTPNGVSLVDETGVVILWNPAQAQITGIPIEEALGQFIWDVQYRMALPEEQSPAAYDRLRTLTLSLLQTGQADWVRPVMERTVRRRDGEIRVLKTRLFALPTAAGFLIASIMRDITAEKRLADRLNVISRAIEQAPMSIIITDANEVIEYANPHLLHLTGYNPDELIGQTPRIFKSGLTPPETYREMWAALSSGHTWRAALQNRKKNGELLWEDMNITPVLDEQGRITHFVAVKEDITRRRQYEEALLKSEQALRQAQALAHVGDWTWDIAANTMRWSDEMRRILGVDPAAFNNDPMAVIEAAIHPDDRARVQAALTAAHQHHPQADEYRVVWPDGSVRHIWSQPGEQVCDEQGRIIRLSGVVQDITQRKEAEIALREAHNRMSVLNRAAYLASSTLEPLRILQMACTELAAAFAATRVAAAVMDEAAQSYRFVAQSECPTDEPIVGKLCQPADSPAAAYIERYNIPLVIDAHNRQQYLPPQRPAWIQTALMIPVKVRDRVHGILCVEFDHARQLTDDQVGFAASFAQTISPAYENSLLHQQMMAQKADLERMVAERTAQLQRLTDRVTTILNNASDSIILVNRSHQIENTNLSFDRTFGYDRDELFGQPVTSLIEAERQADFLKAIQKAWDSDQPQRLETHAHRKDGSAFDADIAIAHVRDNDGHVVCSVRDITHIKEVERVKDQFVSMVSHELRTPVSAIMLSADIVANYYDRLTDDQKLYKLQQIRQQAAVLTDLMTAILDTSRFNARRDHPHLEVVDAAQALRDVVAELLPQADGKMQQIRVLADAPAWLYGDYTDFSRIWRNLIGNAIKYTGNGSIIRACVVKTTSLKDTQVALPDLSAFNSHLPANLLTGDWLVGIVSDNGPGMSERDQAQLFTRFFRGWAAATTIPGSGLGLSLVKEILETYGGDIAVHSALNQGTTFCFWIPLEKGNAS